MASRVLKNNTGSPVTISDTGVTIAASSNYTIPPSQYGKWEGSSDVVVYIGDATLTVNDGTFDLSITDGMRLIQGGFYLPISDGDDPTIKAKVTNYGVSGYENYDKRLYSEEVVVGYDGSVWRKANVRLRDDNRVALCTDTSITSIASGVNAFSQKFRYNDMNVANGGVARNTTIVANGVFVRLFLYTGKGVYTGMSIALGTANTNWLIRLVLDGTNEVFGASGILTTDLDGVYGLTIGTQNTTTYGLGFGIKGDQFYHSSPTYNPIRFDTSIEVYIARVNGSGNKVFQGGLIGCTKET